MTPSSPVVRQRIVSALAFAFCCAGVRMGAPCSCLVGAAIIVTLPPWYRGIPISVSSIDQVILVEICENQWMNWGNDGVSEQNLGAKAGANLGAKAGANVGIALI